MNAPSWLLAPRSFKLPVWFSVSLSRTHLFWVGACVGAFIVGDSRGAAPTPFFWAFAAWLVLLVVLEVVVFNIRSYRLHHPGLPAGQFGA